MNIGFIGCGNMGGALALAVSKHPDAKIYLCDTDNAKTAALSLATGGEVADIYEVAEKCDYVFLGIKPLGATAVLATIKDKILKNERCTIISMMAGVKIEKIESILSARPPIIRILPNTPVTVGRGMTVFSTNLMVTEKSKQEFLDFMAASGTLSEIPEEKIDAACAVMGCGPAFAYMFADALAEGGVSCGLDEDEAILYAAEMMRGAAEMILQSTKTPERLREEVCSPGGSTIEGVKVLFAEEFPEICKKAVQASFKRTQELGK